MVEFMDGPCKTDLMLKNAPMFLRAVVDDKGKIDALDQVTDMPAPDEKVYVYRREGGFTQVHLHLSPRSQSGWYVMAKYRYLPDVDGEQVRETDAWRAWLAEEIAAGREAR